MSQNPITIISPHADIAQAQTSTLWLNYWSLSDAIHDVAAHIEALPSSRTPERYTRNVYMSGLKYWIEWSNQQLPTPSHVSEYIAHLKSKSARGKTGLKSSTIASKYLAPLRILLDKLISQHITASGTIRDMIQDMRQHMQNARAVKTPREDTTTNLSALYGNGTRLTNEQINRCLRQIDRKTLSGKRDYAILLTAFTSALRVAELQRITLNNIQKEGANHLIRVRGKRSNYDPVPIPTKTYDAIMEWVNGYNAQLSAEDGRYIHPHTPLWHPLTKGDTPQAIGKNYKPQNGMSKTGIMRVIDRRAHIAAHDTRRSAAALAYEAGMPLPAIQRLLRHKDAAITLKYIGQKPDYDASNLANYVVIG